MKIKQILARQLLDCKGRPMIEVDVITENGCIGRGSAPTGSSVGMYEAFVLRDQDDYEYHGMSVHKAISNIINIIAPQLIGMDVLDQKAIDYKMIQLDGTDNKRNLGGNAIYSVSIACMRAAAKVRKQEVYQYISQDHITQVPVPSFNVINGGKYDTFIQPFNEFIIMPYKAESIFEAVEMAVNTFQELEKVLTKYLGKKPTTAPSYGYAAPSEDPEVVFSLIQEAIDNCHYTEKMAFALDCASSEMYDKETNTYLLKGHRVTSDELLSYMKDLSEKFNFVFIEDLFDENDWPAFVKATKTLNRCMIIGDDLIVTNSDKLEYANTMGAVNGFILKPNQVGTLTEALATYDYAKKNHLIAVPSGRSGGVIGDIAMDFAVGLQVGFIKNGAPRSGERIDKLNYLMRICSLNPEIKLADLSHLIKFD
ncbi:phosphopyruvate hydratase [Sporolactobacillus laevolacticus]|uniref:Enolase n=1 Tax=Sporolactobacillus laevolacticus DSM 442 TaxID=1395513 RepID=V6IXG5_9BACL|nr:phosphopyruvate hydratase [Sporolactobacillus laevolacticus]EST11341.1 enolase [Sporolactobacillus laevolacticus DSM 442]